MFLPKDLSEKINSLAAELNASKTKVIRDRLTQKYKADGSKSVIENEDESLVYALCRMPATFSVCYTLISNLANSGYLSGISSAIDVGTGTGSAYFSLVMLLGDISVTCYEKDRYMSKLFYELSGVAAEKLDISQDKIPGSADIVVASYLFSELSKEGKLSALKSMFEASKKYVLLVDTGTPQTYKSFMELKKLAKDYGFVVSAPCMNETCPLENDYCQFYARVERSSILRQSKSASQSYEDEKYFYLLFEKIGTNFQNIALARVIRRPIYKPNMVVLTLCTKEGTLKQIITKKNKQLYKHAKELKINEVTDKINGI